VAGYFKGFESAAKSGMGTKERSRAAVVGFMKFDV
jgi:hypothetical protein